jgi:group II intron reverse transcriptase/maturase
MRNADIILEIHSKRGSEGLPLERVYKHLYVPELFLRAYGKIYRNHGATTKGITEETVDGMSLRKIQGIIDLLKQEKYRWTPVRRTELPKPKGGTRPLGIPTWSDKLVQEVLRQLLEPYYEQRFSSHSHGFRPNKSCHSALYEVQRKWKGTAWFIEGDISKCFDSFDHTVMLEIIKKDIHDGRLVRLIEDLLKAGYMEDWRHHDNLSGTPQGGIISPLLANIYLNELDKFVEDTLTPAYRRGDHRKGNPAYMQIRYRKRQASKRGDTQKVKQHSLELRQLMSVAPIDPDFRRLHYIRYADDILLGFLGPKKEAEEIRDRLGEFLGSRLKLTLSKEKTLITHAVDDKAHFLGYEITVTREGNLISGNDRRATNGCIALLMPQGVVSKYRERYSKGGKVQCRAEMVADSDYTILQRYQSVMRGLYNYYCMAVNVGNTRRMAKIKRILETSLTKTLASKYKCSVPDIYRRYQVVVLGLKALQVVIERLGKEPLVATFGGISFERRPEGMGAVDFSPDRAWFAHSNKRSEVVQRLLVGKCELCGDKDLPVEVHHVRKLADIDRPGRRPKADWEKIMSARKRKTLVVCGKCHDDVHAGRYDGHSLH